MVKYHMTFAVTYFLDSRQAEWDFYQLCVFKNEENFPRFFCWWTVGGWTSSNQTSLNFDANINEVHIDFCSSYCKWKSASLSGRFLNFRQSIFASVPRAHLCRDTDWILDAAEQQRYKQRRLASQLHLTNHLSLRCHQTGRRHEQVFRRSHILVSNVIILEF